ncbi:hypothetical protein, partial [Cognataquiflexum rubidum]|uniref:hypothetical protein n=1 Tax=Cognataquiflexum rubidum TaxID=2922273 RepID=UPI001F143DE4
FYVKFLANRLIFLLFYLNWLVSDKAEPGSAGEQPVRNSLIDWNGQGPVLSGPFLATIPRAYALENSTLANPFKHASISSR